MGSEDDGMEELLAASARVGLRVLPIAGGVGAA